MQLLGWLWSVFLRATLSLATWIPVVVGVVSAGLAGWFAFVTKQSELCSQRLLELERQSAATKAEVFQPLVEGIGDMWDQISKGTMTAEWFEKNLSPRLNKFMTWAPVYAADDTVWTFHRLRSVDLRRRVELRHDAATHRVGLGAASRAWSSRQQGDCP